MCADKKQEEEYQMIFLTAKPGYGCYIMFTLDGSLSNILDDEGQPRVFETLVDARDWAVAELTLPPDSLLLANEESWTRLREQAEADRRRKKHEDLPLFSHGKEGE